MRLLRGAIALILLAGIALAISLIQDDGGGPTLPRGSSYSYQPDGTRALFDWASSLGLEVRRHEEAAASGIPTALDGVLFVIQPDETIGPADRAAVEELAARGGTLVLVGDSLPLRGFLTTLGVTLEPVQTGIGAVGSTLDHELVVTTHARNRLRSRSANAEPLLVTPTGDWIALRQPFKESGTLIVVSGEAPLTNDGLRDDDAARWVYRAMLAPALASGAALTFDESHYAVTPSEVVRPVRFRDLLLESPVGRAVLLALGVVFLYLLWAGRRFGPPVPPLRADEASRTMIEHVGALAGLYRRARQLRAVRDHFARHYRREVARALGTADIDAAAAVLPGPSAAALVTALSAIDAAKSEAQLLRAVEQAEAATRDLPRASRGTLSAT